jgi:septum formation protein
MAPQLILASRSPARAALLGSAGVQFAVFPATVDETAVKEALLAEGAPPRDVADTLADLKAARVSSKRPQAYVLGADQVLAIGGTLLSKPADLEDARDQLRTLRGQRHDLISAAVIYLGGEPIWRHVSTVRMTMRAFSDACLDGYVERHGEALLDTVGAYKLEDGGAILFDRIDGDYFSVLGLPLLETLSFLRLHGLSPE